MLRCCSAHPIQPTYASVCLLGSSSLEAELERVEDKLTPCFTAWCSRCRQVSALCTDVQKFPSPSAYYAHLLALHGRIYPRGF